MDVAASAPIRTGEGDFIGGRFEPASGGPDLVSRDPAHDFQVVYRTTTSLAHVEEAIASARAAQPAWQALGHDGRKKHLLALKAAFEAQVEEQARVITREMGKPLREGVGEAKSLGERVALMLDEGVKRIAPLRPEGVGGEARWHPQGVLVVLGPYNYPAHLLNAHVIPALMTGNTVVVKPSEYTPWSGEVYARAFAAAGLPPGVFNLVQGGADVGRALVAHPGADGVLFTGSWKTGRAITEAVLDQPHKIVALEMGGKNAAVVLDDADLPQALASVLQGAFLSAGQRCTATSRLLVEKKIAERLLDALLSAARELRPGDPLEPSSMFGPLAHKDAFERFLKLRANATEAGCEALLSGSTLPGGAYVTPSIHFLPEGHVEAKGYLDEELFGPDLCVEIVHDLDHAIQRVNALPYGLSNAIFTVDQSKFERFYERTRSGLVNWNRSTNGASGKLPFGGVGKSGNQRPAGIEAVRFATFPVAILRSEPGEMQVEQPFLHAVKAGEERLKLAPDRLVLRNQVEALFERHRVYVDDVRGPDLLIPLEQLTDLSVKDNLLEPEDLVRRLAPFASIEDSWLVLTIPPPREADDESAVGPDILEVAGAFLEEVARENPVMLLRLLPRAVRRPPGGKLPRSEAMLRRLYRGDFVPREKKEAVIDLSWCDGAYLASIDDDSLVVLDAGSQIASVGLGYNAGTFLRALDDGELGDALVANPDTTALGVERGVLDEMARELLDEAWEGVRHCTFTSSGAEANEKAFDLCRLHGPGGRRVIAFDGSFHGRTMAALFATSNAAKRKPFEIAGYEAAFVPFPRWSDPREEPPVHDAWISAWTTGQTPEDGGDPLLKAEIESLVAVREEIKKGDVCCVVVEPMQSEGGDNYATARFFNGLRALTRGCGVPLVFDEVQTGFGLGGPFWWHQLFDLKNAKGQRDGPDCITTAKKAQVGACLSVWADPRPQPAHVVQVQRGLLHARGVKETSAKDLRTEVQERLWALAVDYPALVTLPRNQGWTFAFDLPSAHLANQFIAQRFYRGFMAYTAGERTVRFRLNAAWAVREVEMLFVGLREALNAIASKARGVDPSRQREAMESYTAPRWEDGPTTTGEPARTSGGPFAVNYDTMSEDPPLLLRWMVKLPRGPLEKVCDRVLSMEGQFDDERVRTSLARLTGSADDWDRPGRMLERFRQLSDEIDRAPDPAAKYAAFTEELGMEPVRLLAEALGARVQVLTAADWDQWCPQIVAIENATYEEGRRDSEEDLRRMVTAEGGAGVMLLRKTDVGPRVLGYAFGGPVEHYKADGPRDDVMNGRANTFYSANITVAPGARGAGLGQRLKSAQVMLVQSVTDKRGQPRYMFMTGRNRVGHTREMARINRLFGAYVVEHFRGNQYGDRSGQALYYRIPLRRPSCPTALDEPRFSSHGQIVDWASGVQSPLGPRHPRLVQALKGGEFTRAVGTKLTLSNWVTPDVVRYTELLMHFGPKGLGHAYFTSGRDECVDKSIRALKLKRPKGELVLGLERQYVGHTTAAARSLSDPAGEALPFAWFDWPKVPHPAEVGTAASLGAITAVLNRFGPDKILGIFVELLGEKSGLTLPDDFLADLASLRDDTGVPIVAVETASSLGRLGPNLWASDGMRLKPNMVLWYAGGQLGHVFADDAHFVSKPLTLISTWDGDEVSVLRAGHHLLEARSLLKEGRGAAFARRLDEMKSPVRRFGAGLWQVLDLGDDARAEALRKAALRRGLRLGRGLPGRVVLAPPLCVTDEEMAVGVSKLEAALAEVR